MKRFALTIAITIFSAGAASAEWLFQKRGSAFDDATMYLALTSTGSYAFGLRCEGDGAPEAVFLTPEAADEATASELNALDPEMLIRADQGDIHEIGGTFYVSEGTLVMVAAADRSVSAALIGAIDQIAVAGRLLGDTLHETKFGTARSSAVVTRFLEACPGADP